MFGQGVLLMGRWTLDTSPAYVAMDLLSRVMSPYDLNPFGFNPLLSVLTECVDFDRLARSPIKLSITLYYCDECAHRSELISMGAVSDGPERNTPSATRRQPINNAISPTKYVLVFSNKNEIVLLDVNRIEETSAPMRRAWTATFLAPSRRVALKNAAYMQMQADYDCSERRTRPLSLDLYGQDYSHLAGNASRGSWQAIIPESAGDAVLRFVCSDAQMRSKTEISFGDAPFYAIAKAILTGPWPSQ